MGLSRLKTTASNVQPKNLVIKNQLWKTLSGFEFEFRDEQQRSFAKSGESALHCTAKHLHTHVHMYIMPWRKIILAKNS
jgi:hypothetical protein